MTDAHVCIAGGGPAGIVLGMLLARHGVRVTVLERHDDFFRDFRGDTVHPPTLNLIDALGLRDRFDAIGHLPLQQMDVVLGGVRIHAIDFRGLPAPNRFVTLMPQWDLLRMLADAASWYPGFHLRMGTEAVDVIRRDGRVRGLRVRDHDGESAVAADLVVAADGRDSRMRAAAGLVPRTYDVGVDVLWFRLPHPSPRLPDTLMWAGRDGLAVTIPRPEHLQCGLLVDKGASARLRRQGVEAFRDRVVRIVPRLGSVIDAVTSPDDVKLLSVRIDRLRRWWTPGMLCIGDAAHAMSPVFGVGINYAVQDAVAAAALLAPALQQGGLRDAAHAVDRACAAVQRRRLPPTALMQAVQRAAHRMLRRDRLGTLVDNPPTPLQRAVMRAALPAVRPLAARVAAYGFRPERLR